MENPIEEREGTGKQDGPNERHIQGSLQRLPKALCFLNRKVASNACT